MNLGYPPDSPESLGDHAQVHRIVRQVVMSYREIEGDAEIDARIDRKIDKVKLWLLGVVLANLIPVVAFAYMFGQFTGQIEAKLERLGSANGAEIDRRFREVERRLADVERYHTRGSR